VEVNNRNGIGFDAHQMLLWLDGDIEIFDLNEINRQLDIQGFFTMQSHGTISNWTHPGTVLALGSTPSDTADLPNASGGVCGFDISRKQIMQLLVRWKDCALDRECIAPRGSSRKNHRQDQAALSVLMHQFHLQPSLRESSGLVTHTSTDLSLEEMIRYLKQQHY
jgi:hypothetical protein